MTEINAASPKKYNPDDDFDCERCGRPCTPDTAYYDRNTSELRCGPCAGIKAALRPEPKMSAASPAGTKLVRELSVGDEIAINSPGFRQRGKVTKLERYGQGQWGISVNGGMLHYVTGDTIITLIDSASQGERDSMKAASDRSLRAIPDEKKPGTWAIVDTLGNRWGTANSQEQAEALARQYQKEREESARARGQLSKPKLPQSGFSSETDLPALLPGRNLPSVNVLTGTRNPTHKLGFAGKGAKFDLGSAAAAWDEASPKDRERILGSVGGLTGHDISRLSLREFDQLPPAVQRLVAQKGAFAGAQFAPGDPIPKNTTAGIGQMLKTMIENVEWQVDNGKTLPEALELVLSKSVAGPELKRRLVEATKHLAGGSMKAAVPHESDSQEKCDYCGGMTWTSELEEFGRGFLCSDCWNKARAGQITKDMLKATVSTSPTLANGITKKDELKASGEIMVRGKACPKCSGDTWKWQPSSKDYLCVACGRRETDTHPGEMKAAAPITKKCEGCGDLCRETDLDDVGYCDDCSGREEMKAAGADTRDYVVTGIQPRTGQRVRIGHMTRPKDECEELAKQYREIGHYEDIRVELANRTGMKAEQPKPIREAPRMNAGAAKFGPTLGNPFDFARYTEKAAGMSDQELNGALRDIQNTLRNADAMDRENGTQNAGWYRDEASVYRKELAKRQAAGRWRRM